MGHAGGLPHLWAGHVGHHSCPPAIIMGTPLDCNFCQVDHCSSHGEEYVNDKKDPKFNAWWVKKYCTMNGSVNPFMLYFPYFLLLIAMVLFTIERVFQKAFKAGSHLGRFYILLVRENIFDLNIDKEDVSAPSNSLDFFGIFCFYYPIYIIADQVF